MLRSAIRLKQKLRIQFPFLVFNLGVDVRKELMVKVNSFPCSSVPELFKFFFSTNGKELFPFSSELMAELSNKACKFFKTSDQFVDLQFFNF